MLRRVNRYACNALLSTLSLVATIIASAHAQEPLSASDAFVRWAQERAIALQGFPADTASANAVKEVVGTARAVALGEPAHGAHQPLAFRNRFFRYLVEELGYTAIALESGLSESRRAHDFVAGGPGEARQIARDSLTWGFGDYSENLELLRWIRQYNVDPAHRRKVRLYGIDVSGSGSDGEFAAARIALDDALAFLARVAPVPSRRARGAMKPYLDRFTREQYETLSADQRTRLRAAIEDIVALFERERQVLIATSSEEDYEWARRDAIVAQQIEELFRLWPTGVPTAGVAPEFYRAAAARDAAMADNVQWVLRREGPMGRVLVFAHNAHVMNAPLRGGIWNVYPQPPITMGQHLRAALQADLLIVGVSSAQNGADLPATISDSRTVDAVLGRVGLPHFMLDIRTARAAVPWLEGMQSMRANFTTQIVLSLPDAFDSIVFIDRLTAAGSISDESKR
jgi:erythromycin esterase